MELIQTKNKTTAQSIHPGMGTVMSHKLFGNHAEECLRAVRAEADRLESLLSRFQPESDISRINRAAGVAYETVTPETLAVLSQTVEFSCGCQGCFDATIGPLVSLWKNSQNLTNPPDLSDIQHVLPLVDFSDLKLDSLRGTAGLQRKGQSIDLGGIGKGFAGDRIVEVFRDYGIISAYSNLGGNVVTLGTKPDGSPWQIGIQHPRLENSLIGAVSVYGQSVVTSGDYQRFFIGTDGKRYHHILDPLTGYPAESGLISVTIVAENSLQADALSTAVFVAGMEKGMVFLKQYPQAGAILVDDEMQVFVTKEMKYQFRPEANIRVKILG